MRAIRTTILPVLIAALALGACSHDLEGIFYSLEKEIKAPDNTLPNTITVTGMIRHSSTYYVAAGSVFHRDVGHTDWTKLQNPISGSIVSDIAVVSGRVYASFSTGASHGLFELDTASRTYGANIYPAKQIYRLFSLGNELYASVGQTVGESELLRLSGTSLVPTGFPKARRVEAAGMSGTSRWFVTKTEVYQYAAADPGLAAALVPGTNTWNLPGGVSDLRGIHVVSDTAVYLSSYEGRLLSWNGTAWTASADHKRPFTALNRIGTRLVVGTDGRGYYEVDSATLGIARPGGNYLRIPDLSLSTVWTIFVDADKLFLGTVLGGLWRGDYANDPPTWSQE